MGRRKSAYGLQRPTLVLHGRLAVRSPHGVSYKADHLDVPQHSADFIVQAQLLLGTQPFHAIKRRVHMIGQ